MAAEGSEASLPHVEELKVTFDLARAAARDVRVGMHGVRKGDLLVVRAHDFVPRADLALELLDEGTKEQRGYLAPHQLDLEALPPEERRAAAQKADGEAGYLLVPVRPAQAKLPSGGLDLAIVIDASAATEPATLSIARAATSALLSQLGEQDRAVVLAGDDGLRPIVPGWSKLAKVDAAARARVRDALSELARGGSTDLGAMLTLAARELDPARRSAVVYIGDAAPTVGELSLALLRERLGKLPAPVRVFGLGVGDDAKLDVLAGLARGAFAERIGDGYQAARAALRVLEQAERPAWLGTKVDLGPGVERVFPREASALVSGETLWVIGRMGQGKPPERLKTSGPAGEREAPLVVERFTDHGDLGRRWAEARLAQMLEDGEGRAALVDLGMKSGIITPVTSFYVPTANEMSPDEKRELEAKRAVDDDKEGGTGTRAKGEADAKGGAAKPVAASTNRHFAVSAQRDEEAAADNKQNASPSPTAVASAAAPRGVLDMQDPALGRQAALNEAQEFGILGATAAGEKASSSSPRPAGRAGGLGLSSIGDGGGGLGTGPGIGSGHGRLAGAHALSAPKVRVGVSRVEGRLPVEVVQRIVRQNFGRFRVCYEQGLGRNPALAGKITSRFVISKDGSVENVSNGGSDLPDAGVVSCVLSAFHGLNFPQPEGGIVTVTYPVLFEPGSLAPEVTPAPSPRQPINVNVFVGDLPRKLLSCSAAASAPLSERVTLWRERLAKVAGNPAGAAAVYRFALGACEAPAHRERARLLALMLDAMPGVTGKVALFREMGRDLGAADILYRGLLARIRTPEEMRDLHAALGLKTLDPGILAKLVAETPDADARVKKLRGLVRQFPDDLLLALELLNAHEDARDHTAVTELARRLRHRPDADARVRTAVGELYLRQAARTQAASEKAELLAEGRRAFGEIVEFAAEDPVARRRLGDLLLAHRFFAEAARQYETLAGLTPDDPKVSLLQAAAAEGQGLLEEALKWAEKGGIVGAPDGTSGSATTARALSATHLAWARLAALEAKHDDERAALAARAARVLSGGRLSAADRRPGIRVSLTWSHPELHPSLWTNALGTPMPAPDGDITLGISQAIVPERADSFVEVRLEPDDMAHAARLGATAELTVVFEELGKDEKVVRQKIRFQRGGPPAQRFSLAGKEVQGG
jgi:Ca-activated chloride channel family protein